jgi:hypothetical protein
LILALVAAGFTSLTTRRQRRRRPRPPAHAAG